MRTALAFDCSFSELTDAELAALETMGDPTLGRPVMLIQNVWTGSMTPATAPGNIQRALDRGWLVSVYGCTNMASAQSTVDHIAAGCGPNWERIQTISVDVELPTTRDIVLDTLALLTSLGKTPYVYSARWAWLKYMAGTTDPRFKAYKLWNAYYDGQPDIDFWTAPY